MIKIEKEDGSIAFKFTGDEIRARVEFEKAITDFEFEQVFAALMTAMAERVQTKRDAFASVEEKILEEFGYVSPAELGWHYNYITHELTPIKEKGD
jgi:hypothetical protein